MRWPLGGGTKITSLEYGPQAGSSSFETEAEVLEAACRLHVLQGSLQRRDGKPRSQPWPAATPFPMSACGVRREKAALSSGCKAHPATAPAGSNRSSHGGNEVAEAFG